MGQKNVFVTRAKAKPFRWTVAFPDARICPTLDGVAVEACIIWLHNLLPKEVVPNGVGAGVKLVVMSDVPGDEQGLEALAQGACGYCNANAAPEVLQQVAMVVRSGGLWVGESLLTRMVSGVARAAGAPATAKPHPRLDGMSERERDVALRVARGQSNKEIARALNLAERTVKAHLTAAFERLGVRDRLQLALLLNTSV